MWADAIFEGGGVKGIGLVGALTVAEKKGYKWKSVAGTSAGSIIAALVAAGYKAEEISEILVETDFNQFLSTSLYDKIPYVGQALKIWFKNGMYSSQNIETWISKLLEAKGVSTFADLNTGIDLQIIVSDITHGDIVSFPNDLNRYQLKKREMRVAEAVRMSCSIPFFFEPVKLSSKNKDISYMVDGGLLSNFPIWIFDKEKPRWPTIGFRLGSSEGRHNQINGPFTLLTSIAKTMLEAHDCRAIRDNDQLRTIQVPSAGIAVTDFNLSKSRQMNLYDAGKVAAENFFGKFSFDSYLAIRNFESRTKIAN